MPPATSPLPPFLLRVLCFSGMLVRERTARIVEGNHIGSIFLRFADIDVLAKQTLLLQPSSTFRIPVEREVWD